MLMVKKRMKAPLRVLYFDHTAELGGGEIALADLTRHLDPGRVSARVLLSADGPLVGRLEGHIPVDVLPLSPTVVKARKDSLGLRTLTDVFSVWTVVKYVFSLSSYMRRHRIEVLHTNSLKASILGGIAGRLAGVKVIWHVRDRIAEDYLPRKVVRLFRWLADRVPILVIGNSKATVQTLGLRHRRSAVVYSGVDLKRFAQAGKQEERHAQQKVIGLVGRICPWKGQHVFVEAASLLHAHWPGARFRIIGTALFSDQEYEVSLRKTVEERGLQHVVEFAGFKSDIAAAIHSLDILVHASTLGEPFGQVIVQGMACSKPVIATRGGGVPEIVVDKQTGFLVPMGDARAMAEAIATLLADDRAASLMGKLGYERVAEYFTIEASAQKVMNIYEALCGRSAATGQGAPESPIWEPA
jgi:glycosyltransferase involved in cell wall biosynthesis